MVHKRLPDESYKGEWFQAHHSLRRERTDFKADFENLVRLTELIDDSQPLHVKALPRRYMQIARVCERIANNARRTADARERYVVAHAIYTAVNRYGESEQVIRQAGVDAGIALGSDPFFKDAVATNKLFVGWCNMYAAMAQASMAQEAWAQ